MNNKNIIGIDLGTSNCCITYIQSNGTMKIIIDPDFPSNITIPSIISIDNEGVLVGNEVNKIHINSNKNIFHSFKRLIGHNLKDIENDIFEWKYFSNPLEENSFLIERKSSIEEITASSKIISFGNP